MTRLHSFILILITMNWSEDALLSYFYIEKKNSIYSHNLILTSIIIAHGLYL
jgi:hypothetical protein